MKKLYFLFFFTIGLLANAQIINFPDANFKARLLSARTNNQVAKNIYGQQVRIDTDLDGEISVNEAREIYVLDIGLDYLSTSNISNIDGLEYFTSLHTFLCKYNSLTNGTLSRIFNLYNLTKLDISYNQLTSFTVPTYSRLYEINCSFNQISYLDVSNLSNRLLNLYCQNNLLTSLNLSSNSQLQILNCGNNLLTTLDLSFNNTLRTLKCEFNQITNLLVNSPMLNTFFCNNNQITNLDVSNTRIGFFYCDDNNLEKLNVKGSYYSPPVLSISGNPNLHYICCDEEDVSSIITRLNNEYGIYNCNVNSYCSFTPEGTFFEISGNTKLDSNNNGCDVSDSIYPNLNLSITTGTNVGTLISNQTGNYYLPVSAGNHIITPNPENPSYFNISPASFTANFPTQTSPFTQDFCVTANGVKSDVEVILLTTTPARPGFDATYKLVYRNKGNQVENGTVSLTFDDARLDYVAANPVYDSSATNSFTWNYVNLQPFETREIGLVLNVNSPMETPAVNNGDVLNYTATIATTNTDETPTDNIFTLDQTVVGSYDPNDKTCLQGTTITPSEVGKYVHYVIRFENTGTYPAENIVVKDMIDLAKFDITTLVPLKSSHDFFTRLSGNKVEFIFENINLDFNDATNDGYVVFKIKTKPTLVLGNTFTNNANIYFDYNFPITTNTYTTTVAALSSQDFDFGTYFTLYPNPTKDVLNIQSKQDVTINSIEIYNQLGQIVMATTNAINSVDVANLTSGTYFVKVNTEKGSANVKFVKE